MASISLAMVQGQKNAQDLARGQISTLTDMAKSAKQHDETMEYFAKPNVDKRDADMAEQAEINEKLNDLRQNFKDINSNPEQSAEKLISKAAGRPMQVIRDANGNYKARPVVMMPAGNPDMQSPAWQKAYAEAADAQRNTIDLGAQTKDQLLSRALQDYMLPTSKKAEAVVSRAAEDAKMMKRIQEERAKAFGQEEAKMSGLYPHQENIERLKGAFGIREAGIGANATITSAQLKALADQAVANIQKGAGYKDVLPEVKHNAALSLGGTVSYDAGGKPTYKIPAKIDGADTLVDLDMAPADAIAKYNQLVSTGQDTWFTAANRGENPAVSSNAAMRKLAASLYPVLPQGLPANVPVDTRTGLPAHPGGGVFKPVLPSTSEAIDMYTDAFSN